MTNRSFLMLVCLMAATVATAADEPVQVSGFVDASWSLNADTEESTFGLDQTELDLIRNVGESGLVRADIEWVKDDDGWTQQLEQGFLAYAPPFLSGSTVTFGKFNAPIGFELLDAPDMYQFSHALVFDFGLPTNLTGAMVSRPLGERADVAAYWVNGWDVNQADVDGPRTFGGRIGWSLGAMGGVGASVISGEQWNLGDADDPLDDVEVERTVYDVDLTLTPADGWTVGGEFNMGAVTEGAAESDWTGLLVMVHDDVNDWLGFTARYDWFDDPDGAVFGNGADTRTAVVLASTFVLGDGMGALLEIRRDMSDKAIWTDADGEAVDAITTAAFEMTYAF